MNARLPQVLVEDAPCPPPVERHSHSDQTDKTRESEGPVLAVVVQPLLELPRRPPKR
jgi:hypothetical protein